MASRVKEDEKNERIIRSLIKLPGNRRCINCNSLGPQYVCTNFWTFICTTCSGIHREFTHRVKSVSMATFTSQEVASLQGGGNERAREVYLKEWDLQRHSFPDSSNVVKLRDFIKHVYVDRRYTVDKNPEKSPIRKTDDMRSPRSEDGHGRRYSESSSTGGKSPSHELKTSSSPSEVISDWRREDRFTNGRNSEENSASGSPVTRPIRDILGDNAPIRIAKPPSTANSEPINTAFPNQSTNTASLIDFSDPVPGPAQSQTPVTKSASVPTDLFSVGSGGGSWASFDSSPSTLALNDPLEAALAGLTVPAQPVFAELTVPAQPVFAGPTVPAQPALAGPTVPAQLALAGPTVPVQQALAGPTVPAQSAIARLAMPAQRALAGPTVPAQPALAGLTSPAPIAAFPPQPNIPETPPTSESRKALPEDVFALQYPPMGQAWYGYGTAGLNPFEFPPQGAVPALPARPMTSWASPYPFHFPPGPNAGLPPNPMPSGSSPAPSGPHVYAPPGNPFA